MADKEVTSISHLIMQFKDMVDGVEQIASQLEVLNMPRGYQTLRDELRHRVAGKIYGDWMAWIFAQGGGILPDQGIATNAAVTAWRLAEILADLDPESPERQRGRDTLAAAKDMVAGGNPPQP